MLVGLLLACVREVPPEPVARTPRAVRVILDPDETRLEVASRTLVSGDRAVRLVGMVHVADPAFYAAVDGALPADGVLVEGLAPDPAAPPADVVDLQVLGLTFQSDALPLRDGWRRSDLGVPEVRAALVARGVDPAPWLDERDRGAVRALVASATDERTTALARLAMLAGLAGEPPADDAYWDVLVGLRDAAVVADLRDGDAAIVYGADHLPDLEARLVREGFVRAGEEWTAAITVSSAALGLGPVQVRQLLDRTRR